MRLASRLPFASAFAFAVPLVAAAAAVITSGGCSSDPTAPSSCDDDQPPASFDPSTPAVSFSRDVMAVFTQSCAFSTCHGSGVGPANGVFLGRDAPKVHAAIVGVAGAELPSMPFVTPGKPRESYLMRKIDGSQCALDAQCTGGSCQGSMPKNSDLLDPATRDIVRRWIAQGAKND
jgi:hypothetical protein